MSTPIDWAFTNDPCISWKVNKLAMLLFHIKNASPLKLNRPHFNPIWFWKPSVNFPPIAAHPLGFHWMAEDCIQNSKIKHEEGEGRCSLVFICGTSASLFIRASCVERACYISGLMQWLSFPILLINHAVDEPKSVIINEMVVLQLCPITIISTSPGPYFWRSVLIETRTSSFMLLLPSHTAWFHFYADRR